MKRLSWFGLSLVLAGMTGSSISWGHSRGYSHGSHNHYRDHYSGRRNFSLGIGLASTYGAYGHYSYPVGIYGNFNYGRPYSYYRQPYYRPYSYPDSHFYWPAYPPVVYPPVVVVPADPPVYIQQPVRPAPPPAPAVTRYWYYCENPAGYYPDVERCPGGWIKVPPQPAQ
ncbi:hypothetical protein [Nitrosomonas sp.]|uniref:hypothetical protein n=1 Tax=Nitrosomonas sp. TaxID=42353 RepID=UPI0025F2FC63|nr:hypothetical protein [Nitrosomonas sp.]MCC6917378.1 hypothetical protein [Nitrosomonas sp.]